MKTGNCDRLVDVSFVQNIKYNLILYLSGTEKSVSVEWKTKRLLNVCKQYHAYYTGKVITVKIEQLYNWCKGSYQKYLF